MSSNSNVVPFTGAPPFVLEMRSERMIDCLVALQEAGFAVTYIKDSMNRYRITDEVKPFELLP